MREGSFHVLRGGSWVDVAENCRSAARIRRGPGSRNLNVGFRLLRSGGPRILGKERVDSASVSVPAQPADWRRDVLTPTNFQITQGSTIIFTASGRWDVGAGSVGTAGVEATCECLVPEGLLGALVGRIGQNGKPFLIGTGTTFVSSQTGGILFLGANDNMGPCDGSNRGSCYYDNAGSVTVQIEIK